MKYIENDYQKGWNDALDSVYENAPSIQPKTGHWIDTGSEDCVSRQKLKEQMIKYGFHAPDMTVTEFVEDLPPATPQY